LKKLNYKKILVTVLWIIAIAGLFSSWAFVSKKEGNILARSLNIKICNNDENLFLTENEIIDYFSDRNEVILSKEYKKINLPQLEKILNAHPAIESVHVAKDLKGEIKVEIIQRTPLIRVINMDGESYYIDTQSKLMPLSDNFSARVIIASGYIYEPMSRRNQYSINQLKKSKALCEISLLDNIYDVANFINRDSVLSNLIHQIYINKEREIELFPAIGNHKIIFGNTENIAEKFSKLKLFYTEGLNKSDNWTKYLNINLKYKNLVVCTKK
jgi:cell division protein FtsQ